MSGNSLWSWFVSAGDNNVGGALFPENQTRSSLNNGARQVQAEIRTFANDPGWIQYGDGDSTATITQVSSGSFTVGGVDVTAQYHAGRRIKAQGSSTGTIYGTILSSSFSTNTTVTVEWEANGVLASEALTIWLSSQPELNHQTPEHAASRPNLLPNGQFAYWGKGTALDTLNDATLVADHCYLLSDGNDIADISKETTVKPVWAPASLKAEVETANKKFGFLFPLSAADSRMLIGGTASLTFKTRSAAGNATLNSIRAGIISWSSTADAYTVDVVSAWNATDNNPTLVANWTFENTPFSITLQTSTWRTHRIANIAIDTASTANVAVFIWCNDTDATVDDLLYIADVKLEPGPVSTAIPRQSVVRTTPGVFWGGTSGGSANAQTLTGVPGFSNYEVGQKFIFVPGASNSGATTFGVNGASTGSVFKGGGATALTGGELVAGRPAEVLVTAVTPVFALGVSADEPLLPRGYIDGFQMTNHTDADHDIQIAAGAALSSDGTANIKLNSAIIKRIDASWAVGTNQGGLDTGSVGNNTFYAVYAILRPDTGVVDVLFSASFSSPTMPSNYTKSRYIGAVGTDASANIIAFRQYAGGEFRWLDPSARALNVDETVGTTAEVHTLGAPPNTEAICNVGVSSGGESAHVFITPTDVSNVAPSTTASPLATLGWTGSISGDTLDTVAPIGERRVRVDSSRQARIRCTGTFTVRVATIGWVDQRGRDA